MSKKRTFAIVFVSGFFSVLIDAWLDGGWPDFSVSGFLVFVSGLVVISLAFIGFESMYESRKDR
jgi:hypothetical protein